MDIQKRIEDNYRIQIIECCNNCKHSKSMSNWEGTYTYCELQTKGRYPIDEFGICDKYI